MVDTNGRLVMIDFGLSAFAESQDADLSPVGGQTHWSPEKAASEGYSFGSDLWAAFIVFVHMLAGVEPWTVRFRNAHALHYVVSHILSVNPLDAGRRLTDFAQTSYAPGSLLTDCTVYERFG